MNTGAEGVETAIKICRKWAYEKKGILEVEAQIIVLENNFHGRTTTVISFSNDPDARKNFAPYTPGFIKIPYNDLDALKEALDQPNIAGVLAEPIQGEAGVVVPDGDYITQMAELCRENMEVNKPGQHGLTYGGNPLVMMEEQLMDCVQIIRKTLKNFAV